MKKIKVVKQVVGIDIGKDSFYVCYVIVNQEGRSIIKGTKSFQNNISGFLKFSEWCQKRNKTPEVLPVFVMEATGVYYEELAYFLYEHEHQVSVQLAQKLKYFAKGCNIKTKTDKVDARMIAQFGVEKNLSGKALWSPPSKEFKSIRDLSREHTCLKKSLTSVKSQLHALKHAKYVNKDVIELKEQQILFLKEQIAQSEEFIEDLIAKDEKLDEKIKKICTIKGVQIFTVVKILAETNGFLLFNNIRQLVSYAGLDVVQSESGTIKGKTKISKKGNARLRTALYMPAMSAIQYNATMKNYYERVNEGRTIKRQGLIAVMRKLLIIVYTLWKKDEEYVENYQM